MWNYFCGGLGQLLMYNKSLSVSRLECHRGSGSLGTPVFVSCLRNLADWLRVERVKRVRKERNGSSQWPRASLVVVLSAWVASPRSASSAARPLSSFLSPFSSFPYYPSELSPMATQSQDPEKPLSQQQPPSQKPPPKRSLFTRSSSKSRSKNKEIQSASPPQPKSAAQPTSSQSDNHPPTAPQSPPPPATTSTSNPPSSTSLNGPSKSDSATSSPSGNSQQATVPTPPQGSGNQAPAQPATTSSTTVASLPSASPPSAPNTSEHTDDPDREKEKDKGSLSTTLTGTHHTRVSRKGAQTASEGAHSSTAVEQPSPSKSAVKRRASKSPSSSRVSFISRLFRALVPCIGSSRLLNEATNEVSSDPNSSAAALREKPSSRDAEKDSSLRPVQETPVTNDSVSEQPHPNAELAPSTSGLVAEAPRPLHITPPSTAAPDKDLDIIVPPTPTKVIPESETGGVTSSAVVPPGSTADEVAHLRALHSHEGSSGDESDGTSFTEDEEVEDVPGIDEAEDDEDRLILSGGAGIPIGAVSATLYLTPRSHLSQKDGIPRPLLPPIAPQHAGRKCLVLDLDETLVHSSFKVRRISSFD
jgi:RNA polymerase II subunit A small phosphatase-like protein